MEVSRQCFSGQNPVEISNIYAHVSSSHVTNRQRTDPCFPAASVLSQARCGDFATSLRGHGSTCHPTVYAHEPRTCASHTLIRSVDQWEDARRLRGSRNAWFMNRPLWLHITSAQSCHPHKATTDPRGHKRTRGGGRYIWPDAVHDADVVVWQGARAGPIIV